MTAPQTPLSAEDAREAALRLSPPWSDPIEAAVWMRGWAHFFGWDGGLWMPWSRAWRAGRRAARAYARSLAEEAADGND